MTGNKEMLLFELKTGIRNETESCINQSLDT
jgi:hypothetical protein